MNDNAKRWVAALRSGEYKKGKNTLFNIRKKSYCCLGVACQLMVDDRLLKIRTELAGNLPTDHARFCDDEESSAYILIPSAMEWLGLATHYGEHGGAGRFGGGHVALTDLNDDFDLSFNEIADIIESEPEGLFVEI